MAVALAYDEQWSAERVSSNNPTMQLADWRRRVAELYAEIRHMRQPVQAWQHWRKVREHLFHEHPQSPIPEYIRGDYPGIPCFPYDCELRFLVSLTPVLEQKPLIGEIGEGQIRLRPAFETDGLEKALGRELTIFWIEGYGGGLFLPFRDATSGHETYGGGRYLLDAIKGADLGTAVDGRLILDFNFAYHPSCSHNDTWVCPLAPSENKLEFAVRGGERF